jgi:hypothetical protein
VAGAGLPPAPWSARARAGWPRASRERRGEVGVVSGLQVGSWHSPGRLLDAGWGLERAGVRERGGVQSWQDCLRLPPFLCVQVDKTRRIRERERE